MCRGDSLHQHVDVDINGLDVSWRLFTSTAWMHRGDSSSLLTSTVWMHRGESSSQSSNRNRIVSIHFRFDPFDTSNLCLSVSNLFPGAAPFGTSTLLHLSVPVRCYTFRYQCFATPFGTSTLLQLSLPIYNFRCQQSVPCYVVPCYVVETDGTSFSKNNLALIFTLFSHFL